MERLNHYNRQKTDKRNYNPATVIHAAQQAFGFSLTDVEKAKTKVKEKEYVAFRKVVWSVMYNYTKTTLKEQGSYFNRSHDTVIHALKDQNDYKVLNKITWKQLYDVTMEILEGNPESTKCYCPYCGKVLNKNI
jgi:chromosomal replication initiation ATPase DnaA